jgi:hypothetical protein
MDKIKDAKICIVAILPPSNERDSKIPMGFIDDADTINAKLTPKFAPFEFKALPFKTV